jgi:hypothetical protein
MDGHTMNESLGEVPSTTPTWPTMASPCGLRQYVAKCEKMHINDNDVNADSACCMSHSEKID